jgi:hypothetical protein
MSFFSDNLLHLVANTGSQHMTTIRGNLASQGLLPPHGATAKTLVPSGHVNS